jgi:adenosylmethionine-8-amino-7-oxononanoate aminotransferase
MYFPIMMKTWRPYTQEMTAGLPLSVQSALGAHLRLESGQYIFDGISSWWLVTHGHCHPRIQEAIKKQLESLHQIVFANFTYAAAEKFTAKLGEFLPLELNRVFFSDNGSTSVEVAMKMAYQFAKQSGFENKTKFLTFKHSYHGDTCGAMSVSNKGIFTENYQGLLFDVIRCNQGEFPSDPLELWTSDFVHKINDVESQICAVILEPLIQGAGGMIVWPIEAIKTICELCKKKGIPIIFDEVMTGFGRTGTMFTFEQVGIVPEFLCLSKGLTAGFFPMGLTITKNEIFEAFLSSKPQNMFFHGHSYTGNALSCAAALANLELWQEENPLNKLKEISAIHTRALKNISSRIPVQNSRVCGTIGAINLMHLQSAPKDSNISQYGGNVSHKIYSKCLQQGVFVRPLGSTIYLMPPYCSNRDDIEMAWRVIEKTIYEL